MYGAIEHKNTTTISPIPSWTKSRKFKVAVLTTVSVVCFVLLLFEPEFNGYAAAVKNSLLSVTNSSNQVQLSAEFFDDKRTIHNHDVLVLFLVGSFVDLRYEMVFYPLDKLEVSIVFNGTKTLDTKNIGLIPDSTTRTMTRVKYFTFKLEQYKHEDVTIVFSTTSNSPVPILANGYFISSSIITDGVAYGAAVLVSMYALLVMEAAHRTVITMLSATLVVGILANFGRERPSLEHIINWMDVETLTLLFSMMVIVSVISETNFFGYIGFKAFKISKGRTWPMVTVLCLCSAVISAFLDNVTTVLLLSPVVVQLCETVKIDVPGVLIIVVIFSNLGGTATVIGDPPNVLIASDPIIAESVTFFNFALHMTPAVLLISVTSFLLIRFVLCKNLVVDPSSESINREIGIWRKLYDRLPNSSTKDDKLLRMVTQDQIQRLEENTVDSDIEKMRKKFVIRNKPLLLKCGIVLSIMVTFFFLQNLEIFRLSLGWISLLGAISLLVLADVTEVESIFARVEWTTLIFFATLFVIMEGLNNLGLLDEIGNLVKSAIEGFPDSYRLSASVVLILWTSGLASAFIDNIPFTTMMIPIITNLSEDLSLPLQPLVWSLALGTCLGGNGTVIGASANLVCAGIAEQYGYKFTFLRFFKIGFPVMILSLVVSTVYLMICHVAFQWH